MNLNYFTKFRGILLLLFCLALHSFALAQDAPKQQEIGVLFRSFDSFGLTYRTGTEKSLWRFNSLIIRSGSSTNSDDDLEYTNDGTGFGVGLGKEWRKEIAADFELRYGADLSFSYSHSKQERDDQTSDNYDNYYSNTIYTPGIRFVLGLNYVIQDKLVLGAEVLPGVSYYTGQYFQESSNPDLNDYHGDISGFTYGLNSTSVLLSVLYRF